MKIDATGFTPEWAWGHTEEEFIKEFSAEPMGHVFPDAADKPAKLREAYQLLQQGKPADFKMPKAAIPATVIDAGKSTGETKAQPASSTAGANGAGSNVAKS
jgi:hypothetical protein